MNFDRLAFELPRLCKIAHDEKRPKKCTILHNLSAQPAEVQQSTDSHAARRPLCARPVSIAHPPRPLQGMSVLILWTVQLVAIGNTRAGDCPSTKPDSNLPRFMKGGGTFARPELERRRFPVLAKQIRFPGNRCHASREYHGIFPSQKNHVFAADLRNDPTHATAIAPAGGCLSVSAILQAQKVANTCCNPKSV